MPTEQCIVKELGNMNKATLIAKIAEKTGLNKKQAEAAANAFTDTILEALKEGDKVQLIGFGTFEVKERAARVTVFVYC